MSNEDRLSYAEVAIKKRTAANEAFCKDNPASSGALQAQALIRLELRQRRPAGSIAVNLCTSETKQPTMERSMGSSPSFHNLMIADSTGALATIGPVTVGIDRHNLQVLVDAVAVVQSRLLTTPVDRDLVGAGKLPLSDWQVVGYVRSRKSYSLRYRGVAWEVLGGELDAFVANSAIPALPYLA